MLEIANSRSFTYVYCAALQLFSLTLTFLHIHLISTYVYHMHTNAFKKMCPKKWIKECTSLNVGQLTRCQTELMLTVESPCSRLPMTILIIEYEWHHPSSHLSFKLLHLKIYLELLFGTVRRQQPRFFIPRFIKNATVRGAPPFKSPQSAIICKLNMLSCYYHNHFLPPRCVSIHNLIFYALPLFKVLPALLARWRRQQGGRSRVLRAPRREAGLAVGQLSIKEVPHVYVVDKWVKGLPGAQLLDVSRLHQKGGRKRKAWLSDIF